MTARPIARRKSCAASPPRIRACACGLLPPLPRGWNGKQHACHALAAAARSNVLCFLDADVRLAPEALACMSAFLERSGSDLVSGFPRQETETPLEWLIAAADSLCAACRICRWPACVLCRRPASRWVAVSSSWCAAMPTARLAATPQIRTTMHDGLLLPQLFRRHGLRTDIADLTHLATCRMYHNASEVWHGLAKNATEGMAAPARILPFTFLLFCGQVLPFLLALSIAVAPASYSEHARTLILVALAASFVPRLLSVWKYRQSLVSALLHPLGVTVLLALQWYALLRKLAGQQVTWKERAYRMG